MAARGPQNVSNKFFDPGTPSMRKVDDREKKKKKNDVVYSDH